jgi:2-keto-myo-inositol isomerase
VMTDLGLTPVSSASEVAGLWEPNPNHAAALDNLKRRCEMFTALGFTKTYAPVTATATFKEDDYKAGVDNMRKVGDVARQFGMTAMAEFTRASTFIATLGTMLRMIRETAHPNMRALFDCYHFWSGQSKFEDLDLVKPGEIAHVHFNDVPDMPRELLGQATRVIPGDGVTPLVKILRKLAEKGYEGPISVELFLPKFQEGDPFEVAQDIRRKCEAVMRQARVI